MADRERTASVDRRLAALFPEAGAPGDAPRRPWYRRVAVVVPAALVILVVVALVATQAFGGSGATYRTATATTEHVDAVQTGVATIEPVAQATVAFPVSGTVATVNVHVGDHVDASGTLASLDTTALARTLHEKQAALAQAQLNLSKGLAGQSIPVGASGAGSGTASANTAAARTGSTARLVLTAAAPDPQLAAAQQAVLTAQQHVDAALGAAATALTAETQACASFTGSTTSTTTSTPSSPSTPSTPPSAPDVTACQQAIAGVSSAQSAVADAQQALAQAANDLDTVLANLGSSAGSGAPPAGGTGNPGGNPGGNTAGGSSGGSVPGGAGGSGAGSTSRTGSTAGGTSAGPSAADLVAAQRNVDAAAMATLASQQSMDEATISSPLAGTVVAVDMKVGDVVSAGSSTENIVVAGAGGYEVSTLVGVDQIPSVHIGETATVEPDGRHRQLPGKVVAISVAPASSSTASTTYRVVVGLTRPDADLQDGATGTVAIVTKDARAALAVPTSAIITVRNRHFVNVVHGGAETLTPVQVGVVGATWTEIRSGVGPGTEVALADVSAPLPSSATSSANGQTTTPFGGFGRLFGGNGTGGGGGGFTRGGRGG